MYEEFIFPIYLSTISLVISFTLIIFILNSLQRFKNIHEITFDSDAIFRICSFPPFLWLNNNSIGFFQVLPVQDETARIDETAVQDRRREKTCRREETSRNRGSDPQRAQLGIPHVHLTDFLSPDAVIVGFGNSIHGFGLRKVPGLRGNRARPCCKVYRFF